MDELKLQHLRDCGWPEAADEIERLREDTNVVHADICAENDNLQADNERLRRTLERIAADDPSGKWGRWAREALNQEEKTMQTEEPFAFYRNKSVVQARPYQPGEDMTGIIGASSPKKGDIIARNPKNHAFRWLIPAAYFADNFEPV